MNNQKSTKIISDLEKSIMAAKVGIQQEIFLMPTKMGLSFTAFAGEKPRNLQMRYKGIAG